jgi:predicted amidohydrolase
LPSHEATIRVAAAQLGPASDTRELTLERIVGLIQEAASREVSLVCFPELALGPYFAASCGADIQSEAVALDGQEVAQVADCAREHEIAVLLPLAERSGRGIFNSVAFIDVDGHVRGAYRKVHVPAGFWLEDGELNSYERSYFAPGPGYEVWPISGFLVSPLICYDRFYPEASRIAALMGAEILTYPSNVRAYGAGWASDAWEIVLRTRAYENGCFVVAPAKAGIENGQPFLGQTLIASPIGGQVLARATTEEDELCVAELQRTDLDRARGRFNFVRDRRTDTYGALTS